MPNINRKVSFQNEGKISVDLNTPVARYPQNPILTSVDVNKVWCHPALRVKTVHNAGVTTMGDETIMLFRSHLRCGISIIGIARSKNGIDHWHIEPKPVLKPATSDDVFAKGTDKKSLIENEGGGLEDPRIAKIGDTFAITYSAYNATIKDRVRVSLVITQDFVTFTRHGPLMDCDMRNVVLFNEKINDRFMGLFRPNDVTPGCTGGKYTQIKIGYTRDWKRAEWEMREEPIIKTGDRPSPFADKIGPGAPPIKTKKGWLSIFHGVRTTMDGNPYVLGVALHDLDDPSRVKVSSIPILFPTKADCRVEEDAYIHVPNVVFSCGAVRRQNGSILIYYGGNDTVMNVGITHEDVLIALCELYPQDAKTGKLSFQI